MSFSSDIKDELCRVEPGKDCCKRAELASAFYIGLTNGAPADSIITENAAFARRVYRLLRDLRGEAPTIAAHKKPRLKKSLSYAVKIETGGKLADTLSRNAPNVGLSQIARKKCCKKAALRGAFLSGGSATDPEKHYHLEIYCKNYELAHFFTRLMEEFDLKPKITKRTDYIVAYIKDSDAIADFLSITGAFNALLSLENTRILKGMRNDVNRSVNFETANIGKTADASLRQIANILYIKETTGFECLPRNLREIAEAREQNRDVSLVELGQMLDPPLGKSGVNHRLRKLESIAVDIRVKRGLKTTETTS